MLQLAADVALDYRFRIWGFGEGPALLGLLATGEIVGTTRYFDAVEALVLPWARRRELARADHVASAEVLLALADRTGIEDYRDAAQRWGELVLSATRPDPAGPPTYRPDLPGLETMTWVDTLHTHGPGLALLGLEREAVDLVEEASTFLQDDSGLYCHGYDVARAQTNGVHWGRGCGWALWGLLGTRAVVEDPALATRTERLLQALAQHERAGRWHTIVDDDASPLESSVSAFVAAAVIDGVHRGLAAPHWLPLGERALAAALADARGGALPVSEATPVGEPEIYCTRATGAFPWGQGPLLLALAARHGWSAEQLPSTKELG